MHMIVAVDQHWGIGKNNQLLVQIPADMKLFRKETEGKVVIMGRRTLESLPNGLPLQNRTNIILTQNQNYHVRGGILVHTLKELLELCQKYDSDQIYVIGGSSIYHLLLPYCSTVHVTKIDYTYEADRFFPNLDEDSSWEITAQSEEQTYFDLEYTFLRYERKL